MKRQPSNAGLPLHNGEARIVVSWSGAPDLSQNSTATATAGDATVTFSSPVLGTDATAVPMAASALAGGGGGGGGVGGESDGRNGAAVVNDHAKSGEFSGGPVPTTFSSLVGHHTSNINATASGGKRSVIRRAFIGGGKKVRADELLSVTAAGSAVDGVVGGTAGASRQRIQDRQLLSSSSAPEPLGAGVAAAEAESTLRRASATLEVLGTEVAAVRRAQMQAAAAATASASSSSSSVIGSSRLRTGVGAELRATADGLEALRVQLLAAAAAADDTSSGASPEADERMEKTLALRQQADDLLSEVLRLGGGEQELRTLRQRLTSLAARVIWALIALLAIGVILFSAVLGWNAATAFQGAFFLTAGVGVPDTPLTGVAGLILVGLYALVSRLVVAFVAALVAVRYAAGVLREARARRADAVLEYLGSGHATKMVDLTVLATAAAPGTRRKTSRGCCCSGGGSGGCCGGGGGHLTSVLNALRHAWTHHTFLVSVAILVVCYFVSIGIMIGCESWDFATALYWVLLTATGTGTTSTTTPVTDAGRGLAIVLMPLLALALLFVCTRMVQSVIRSELIGKHVPTVEALGNEVQRSLRSKETRDYVSPEEWMSAVLTAAGCTDQIVFDQLVQQYRKADTAGSKTVPFATLCHTKL